MYLQLYQADDPAYNSIGHAGCMAPFPFAVPLGRLVRCKEERQLTGRAGHPTASLDLDCNRGDTSIVIRLCGHPAAVQRSWQSKTILRDIACQSPGVCRDSSFHATSRPGHLRDLGALTRCFGPSTMLKLSRRGWSRQKGSPDLRGVDFPSFMIGRSKRYFLLDQKSAKKKSSLC